MNWFLLTVLLADLPAKSLVVLPFSASRDVDPKTAMALTEAMMGALRQAAGASVQIVDPAALPSDVRADLAACGNAACMTKLGAPLHADQLCVGRLDQAGPHWLLHVKLVDLRRGVLVGQADRRLESLHEALDALPQMVGPLALKAYPGGWLDVSTDPNGLAVLAGSQPVGHAPLQLRLPPGPLILRVDDPCYEPTPQKAEVKEGQHLPVALAPHPKLVPLHLQLHDSAGAVLQGEASLDGKPLGAAAGTYQVPLCAQQISVIAHSGQTFKHALALQPGAVSSIDAVVPAPPPSLSSKTPAFILLGAGVAVLAGGVVLDTVPASARDHRFEFTDVLGPVCYAVGAALGVVGLVELLH